MEDPRPTLQHFFIMMEGTQPWGGCEDKTRDPGDLFGVTFQVSLVILRFTKTVDNSNYQTAITQYILNRL